MSYVTSHLINETEHNAWTECPCCGEIISYHESTIEIIKGKGKTYIFCNECDNKIKI